MKTKKTIVIRADASTRIGIGHVMRCLTLAAKLNNAQHQIIFLCKQHHGNLIELIKSSGFEVIALSKPTNNIENEHNERLWLGCHYQQDAKECLKYIQSAKFKKIDLLIVDHYSLDYQWQDMLSPFCDKIMVIDDLANREHHCDILLDQTFGRSQQDYRLLIPEHCTLLLGKEYMLLRDEFYKFRSFAQSERISTQLHIPSNILISLGGVDPDNIASSILNWLILLKADFNNIKVCLVANANSNFLNELNTIVHKHQWIRIVTKPPSMATLMLKADIAIGSSGATAWERCCLGLPTLSIISADNQKLVDNNLTNAGASISLGYFKKLRKQTFVDALTLLFNDQKYYQKMVQQCFDCCDGLGAGRVAIQVAKNMNVVELVPATINDIDVTFKWQSDKSIRQYFKQPTTPTKAEHWRWFERNLSDVASSLYIIHYNKVAVGTLRFDEHRQNEYTISILIAPSEQGKGIALRALNKISQLKENGLFFADIHQDNLSSIRVFKKAGFVPVSASQYCLKIKAHKK